MSRQQLAIAILIPASVGLFILRVAMFRPPPPTKIAPIRLDGPRPPPPI